MKMTVDTDPTQEQLLTQYRQAQARVQEAQTPIEVSYARVNLGLVHFASSQFEPGLAQFDQAIEIAQQQADHNAEAEHIGTKGLALLEADKPGEACACFEQVLTLAEALDDNLYRSDALGNIGLALAAMGDPQPGLAKLNNALKLATTLHDSRRAMTHLGNIAHIYLQTGHAAEAVKYYYKAYTLAQQLFDTQSQTGYLNNIGVIFAQQSEYRRAAEAFETVLTLAQEAADAVAEGTARQYLVKCYTEIGPVDKLIEHIGQLIETSDDTSLWRAQATALIERLFTTEDYQSAADFLAQLSNKSYIIKDKDLYLELLANLGYAYSELGRLTEAIQVYESALSLPRQLNNPAVEARLLGRLGSIYADKGDLERSTTYTTGAIELARSLNDLRTEGELLCLLALNYRDLGQTAQALDYCEQAIEIFQKSDEHALAAKALNLKLELQPEKQTI
jgi:tetratricopeptide (TPR) repeat protein